MSKTLKWILLGVLVVFVFIQFLGPERPDTSETNSEDLLVSEVVNDEIAGILKTACYDCHSMESRFPWYASIAPVSWRIYGHIDHGREEMNLSDWASLKRTKKIRVLRDIAEVVGEHSMPLNDYILLHSDAKLTDDQREAIVQWADAFSREVLDKR